MLVNWWMSHSPKPAPAEPPGAGTRPVSGSAGPGPWSCTRTPGPRPDPGPSSTRAGRSNVLIRSGRLSAGQEGLIHPGVDINTMAGSHVDEVLQACAVSRYLVRVVRLDRGEDALLGHGDLYLQLLTHAGHLLPRTRRRRDGETGYLNDGPAKRCPACRHRRPRPQDLRQLRCADDSVTAVAVARIPRGPSDRADAGPHVCPGPGTVAPARASASWRSSSRTESVWSALEQVGGLVDHGPVALIGMNTRVDARDVPPTTVIEDIEFVQAQVQRFAEAQLASA